MRSSEHSKARQSRCLLLQGTQQNGRHTGPRVGWRWSKLGVVVAGVGLGRGCTSTTCLQQEHSRAGREGASVGFLRGGRGVGFRDTLCKPPWQHKD